MMISSRSIIRGSFRISIVAAILAAAYAGSVKWIEYAGLHQRSTVGAYDLATALECGAGQPQERLKAAANTVGLIDLAKVGCSTSPALASLDELQKARRGTMREELMRTILPINYTVIGMGAATYAIAAFLLVNLLGFAFIAARRVFRWVSAGFSAS